MSVSELSSLKKRMESVKTKLEVCPSFLCDLVGAAAPPGRLLPQAFLGDAAVIATFPDSRQGRLAGPRGSLRCCRHAVFAGPSRPDDGRQHGVVGAGAINGRYGITMFSR